MSNESTIENHQEEEIEMKIFNKSNLKESLSFLGRVRTTAIKSANAEVAADKLEKHEFVAQLDGKLSKEDIRYFVLEMVWCWCSFRDRLVTDDVFTVINRYTEENKDEPREPITGKLVGRLLGVPERA